MGRQTEEEKRERRAVFSAQNSAGETRKTESFHIPFNVPYNPAPIKWTATKALTSQGFYQET